MSDKCYLAPHVRSFFEDYLVCRRNVSRNTIESYRDGLKIFLRFAETSLRKSATKMLVSDLTESLVIEFLADLEVSRGNSIQTRNYRLCAIHGLCRFIGSRDPMLLDHCHRIVTIPKKRGAPLPEIQYLEKDEMNGLLTSIPKTTPLGRRDHAMLLFMYNTGARVQEVVDTRTTWITLTSPYKVELLGKGRKWRTCPLWESTVIHLRQLMDERNIETGRDESVFVNRFGSPLSRSGISDIIRRRVCRCATTESLSGKTITPHTLRHTTAMHLLQSGVEINVIRSWLGHVSIATTNRYIEIDLAMKAKALETCDVGSRESTPASWKSDPDILGWLESL